MIKPPYDLNDWTHLTNDEFEKLRAEHESEIDAHKEVLKELSTFNRNLMKERDELKAEVERLKGQLDRAIFIVETIMQTHLSKEQYEFFKNVEQRYVEHLERKKEHEPN